MKIRIKNNFKENTMIECHINNQMRSHSYACDLFPFIHFEFDENSIYFPKEDINDIIFHIGFQYDEPLNIDYEIIKRKEI